MVNVNDLAALLDEELAISDFDDYAPNGLQVAPPATAGRDLRRVVFGVSANQALLDAAVDRDADAVVVHHGFFWRNEPAALTGIRARRIATLFTHDIALYGYHLPLDAHPTLGNAAGLLAAIDATDTTPFTVAGRAGTLRQTRPLTAVVDDLEKACGPPVAVFDTGARTISQVAVVTGGGPGYFEHAAAAGVDLFVTGEVSEQTQGLARELGVAFAAFGHHATERFGPQALAGWVEARTGIDCAFVDITNPA